MHSGKSYKLSEFLLWTRRNIYKTLVIGIIPVVLYQIAGLKWLAIPWTVVALLGTATAFIVGFKNTQTYNRTWEARQIWGAILNSSRAFGTMSRDFLNNSDKRVDLPPFCLAYGFTLPNERCPSLGNHKQSIQCRV
jgi:ion channel-forming bestrophin family protein